MRAKKLASGRRTSGISFQIVISLILIMCFSAVGFCGYTPILTVEALGGETGDIYGVANIPIVGLIPGFEWTMDVLFPNGVEIRAQNNQDLVLGTVNEADITIIEDPQVTLGFSVTAGQYATAFSFSSPVLSFAPINNPEAYASGSVSAGEGDTLYGGYYDNPDFDIFKALYNTDGGGAGGTTFADFVPDSTGFEFVIPQTINDTVSSIHIKSSFILSGGGIASGSSVFNVEIPEPATVCLLALGGLVLRKKRNK